MKRLLSLGIVLIGAGCADVGSKLSDNNAGESTTQFTTQTVHQAGSPEVREFRTWCRGRTLASTLHLPGYTPRLIFGKVTRKRNLYTPLLGIVSSPSTFHRSTVMQLNSALVYRLRPGKLARRIRMNRPVHFNPGGGHRGDAIVVPGIGHGTDTPGDYVCVRAQVRGNHYQANNVVVNPRKTFKNRPVDWADEAIGGVTPLCRPHQIRSEDHPVATGAGGCFRPTGSEVYQSPGIEGTLDPDMFTKNIYIARIPHAASGIIKIHVPSGIPIAVGIQRGSSPFPAHLVFTGNTSRIRGLILNRQLAQLNVTWEGISEDTIIEERLAYGLQSSPPRSSQLKKRQEILD